MPELWLDCADVDSTLDSLSSAIGTDRGELDRALRDYDEERFDRSADSPEQRLLRVVLGHFGTDVDAVAEHLAGAYCFHGTRVRDPQVFFRRGILPRAEMLEEIWATLHELVHSEILGCPETVQDIAWCYQGPLELDLERRFCDASTPCIVKFRSRQCLSGAIQTALWYAFLKLRYDALTHNTSGYTGEGCAVPAEDVVDVEVVAFRQ